MPFDSLETETKTHKICNVLGSIYIFKPKGKKVKL